VVWHLFPVLKWLEDHARYSVSQALMDAAHIAMQINLARESKQLERSVQREISTLVAQPLAQHPYPRQVRNRPVSRCTKSDWR
jgi:hypothetical protein